jgi:excisionase family DNA binding protein
VDKLLLNIDEAAEVLSVSHSKIYALLRQGDLSSVNIGGLRRIPTATLVAFVTRLTESEPLVVGLRPPPRNGSSPIGGDGGPKHSPQAVDACARLSRNSALANRDTQGAASASSTNVNADAANQTPPRRRSPNGHARPYFDKSKGRWYQVVSVDGQRKKVSGATQREVTVLAKKVNSHLRAGIIDHRRRTVGELLDYWSVEVVPEQVRESTLDGYQRAIRLYLKPVLGRIRLSALEFDDVEHMQQVLVRQGKARQTILQARKVLSAALKWAVKKGWLAENAVAYAGMPKGTAPARVTRHLDAVEFGRLRDRLAGDRLECAYLLCCYLGLRRGEVLGLVWGDIDLLSHQITIARQLRRATSGGPNGKTGLVLTRPKTSSSIRTLRLPECATEAILNHRSLQQSERRRASSWSRQPREGQLVFTSLSRDGKRGGSPVDIDSFGQRLVRHAQAAGIGHLSPHGLRHTGVSFLYNEGGVDMKALSEWAGHADEHITSSVYVHMTQRRRDDVADRMDAIVAALPPRSPAH